MAKIVIAGGTGNLGDNLAAAFLARKDELIILSRKKQESHSEGVQLVQWDGKTLGNWTQALEGVDVLINLSGASINRIFNEKNKALLRSSRIEPTEILGQAIQQLQAPPKLWINASGVSIFNGMDSLQDERSTQFGHDFLADLVREWEHACRKWETPRTKKVILRISPVLMRESGMFKELYPLAKFGMAGQVGNGKQMVSWIHIDDFVNLILWICTLENPSPLYHACSPNPLSNADFMKTIRQAAGVSIGIPLPAMFAKIAARAKGVDPVLLLETVPVTTLLASKEGFFFKFPYLQPAINQLINQST